MKFIVLVNANYIVKESKYPKNDRVTGSYCRTDMLSNPHI